MKQTSIHAICAAISFLFAFVIILMILLRYPIMYGIDGPYYLIQMRHLVSDGVIKYPDPPLTYYMLAPFYILSADKNLGLKMAVAFYGGLTAFVLYAAFRRFGDLSGLAASLTFILSPFTLRLLNDFIKNYVSLLFIAIFIYTLLNVKKRRHAVMYSSLAVIASAISHVLTFGVFAIYSLLIFIFCQLKREYGVERDAAASAVVTSFLILILALTVAPQIVGYDTRKLLSFVENPFDHGWEKAHFTNFAASLVIGFAGIAYSLKHRGAAELSMASGVSLILVNLPIIGSAWLFRFSLMTSILVPPIAAVIIGEVNESSKFMVFTLVTGLMLMTMLPAVSMLKPSITMRDYEELRDNLPKYVPPGSTLVIPDTKVRYWVEALHEEIYEIVKLPPRPPQPGTYLVLKKPVPPGREPPHGEVVLDGDYIRVLKLR